MGRLSSNVLQEMRLIIILAFISAGTIPVLSSPVEPFFEALPPGVFVENSFVAPKAKTTEFSTKLGGEIDRVTNSRVKVQGRTIQLNCITALDEASAERIHQKIGKPFPFSFRRGLMIIEYVGKGSSSALALKTSYELGLLKKPDRIQFTYIAELATVDQADYMSCNPLFNEFLKLQGGDISASDRIESLIGKFSFGNSLTLRSSSSAAAYTFEPQPQEKYVNGSSTTYSFGDLSTRNKIPFITLRYQGFTTSNSISSSGTPPSSQTTVATSHWPVDNPKIKNLAKKITRDATSNEDKAQAILEWLKPGTNLKYSGRTGTRWGTLTTLEQGFGHCWDFSDVFVTLCRASGVPCRQVAGWLYGTSGHVWAEYYVGNKGWRQVDSTGGGSLNCGIYHIPLFTSEDGKMPIVYLSMPQIKAEQEDAANPAKQDG